MEHFFKLYDQATLRAEVNGAGLRFLNEDRKLLVAALEGMKGVNYKDVAHAIARREWDGTGVYNNVYARHVGRLAFFIQQFGTVQKEEPEAPELQEEASAPINATVQEAVDNLLNIVVKHGVSSTHALLPYIHRSIEKRKAAQKISQAAERILEELRGTGLTREQILATLASVNTNI